jgi:hypothetical protein
LKLYIDFNDNDVKVATAANAARYIFYKLLNKKQHHFGTANYFLHRPSPGDSLGVKTQPPGMDAKMIGAKKLG